MTIMALYHTYNIYNISLLYSQLRADAKCSEEKVAVEHAGKAVRQLGSLMFEMEVLRSFLETSSELRYFDGRVNPAKIVAHRAVNKLKGFS